MDKLSLAHREAARIKEGPDRCKKWWKTGGGSRYPLRSQGPGPRTKYRAEAIQGHGARSPQPGGRRFAPGKKQSGLAASPSAAIAQPQAGLASPARPPPTRPGSSAQPRRPSARAYFLGVHGQGLCPLNPKPRRRTLRGDGGRSDTTTRLPGAAALLSHRRLCLSLRPHRRRPAAPRPRPAPRAPQSRRRCQGERAARGREGARSALRTRPAARRDGEGWKGAAGYPVQRRSGRERGVLAPRSRRPFEEASPSFPHRFSSSARDCCRLWNGPLGIQQPGPWGGQGKESSGSGDRSAPSPSCKHLKHLLTLALGEAARLRQAQRSSGKEMAGRGM